MSEVNIYKAAALGRYRYEVQGLAQTVTTEDLSLLNLGGSNKITLDKIFKALKAEISAQGEESILDVETPTNEVAKIKLAIVLDVVADKKAALAKVKDAAENKVHNQKVLALIAAKDDEQMQSLSKEELVASLR